MRLGGKQESKVLLSRRSASMGEEMVSRNRKGGYLYLAVAWLWKAG